MYGKPKIEVNSVKTEPIEIVKSGTNGTSTDKLSVSPSSFSPSSNSPSSGTGQMRKLSMGKLYSRSPEERLIVSLICFSDLCNHLVIIAKNVIRRKIFLTSKSVEIVMRYQTVIK